MDDERVKRVIRACRMGQHRWASRAYAAEERRESLEAALAETGGHRELRLRLVRQRRELRHLNRWNAHAWSDVRLLRDEARKRDAELDKLRTAARTVFMLHAPARKQDAGPEWIELYEALGLGAERG